jgi:DNA-binding GntR family transcriptional regulator
MPYDPRVADATADLRRRLAAGEWSKGDQFPTFDELMERYPGLTNIYRVREALSPLIQDGLIESRHGVGSFVLRKPTPLPAGGASPASVALDLVEQLRALLQSAEEKIEAIRAVIGQAA